MRLSNPRSMLTGTRAAPAPTFGRPRLRFARCHSARISGVSGRKVSVINPSSNSLVARASSSVVISQYGFSGAGADRFTGLPFSFLFIFVSYHMCSLSGTSSVLVGLLRILYWLGTCFLLGYLAWYVTILFQTRTLIAKKLKEG